MNKVLGIFIVLLTITSCTTVKPAELKGGYIVPDSCGDRWVCEKDCDPDYPWLCEPWSL